MPAANAPTPIATNIRPSCDTVEYASTRLMSFCTRPIVPAISAVATPMPATIASVSGACAEQHGVAPDHVHARRHHRRGVDQRRDRRRAFHRVGQPDVAGESARTCRWRRRTAAASPARGRRTRPRPAAGRPGAPLPGSRAMPNCVHTRNMPEQEPEVADAVDDEGLLAGVGGRLLREPEPDQQVRAEAHAFPADEHHREVGAEHQHEHERREQVQVREVARVLAVALLVHVGRRVDVDEEPDARHDEDHHRRRAGRDAA